MKNRRIRTNGFLIITALTVIGCCVGLTARRGAIADSAKNVATPMPALHGRAAFRHLEQTGLRNSLWAAVNAARYGVEPRKGGGYESANPGQKYRAIFTPQGVDVRGSSGTGGGWRLGMRLTAYGYGVRKKAVIATGLKVAGERVEYERRSRDGAKLSEWYVNRAEGLEQGFTIPRAPGKRRAGEKLNLWLRLSGDLKARSADKGQAILLDGRGAGAGLRYDGLKAYDAIGRGLESRMKLSGDRVKIEVMDETAVYPVTIDPTLSQEAKLTAGDAASGDQFGAAVGISGETAVVGAPVDDTAAGPNAGSAYVFVRSGTGWSQQAKLTASDAAAGDIFGFSVAVTGDTVVVGASGDNMLAGSAYVFVRSGTGWSQQAKLTASDAASGDRFGAAVGISGDTAVVGAQFGDTIAGSAYVFVRSGTSWSQQAKLTASDAAAFDFFGAAVAISGDTVVVGALADDTDAGSNAGSAYVFVSAPTNTPPAITAASVYRTQGLPASIGAIAQVKDAEDAPHTLTVTVNGAASATAGGVTVSSISVDASGQVTASVGADCNASNASFTLRVADSGGLFVEATLNVTVTPETIPPVIACPVNVVMTLPPNTMDTQMVVNYPAPSATDNCTASPTITTSQASGTVFPVGLTTVNVTATDAANNQATCSFTVTVRYNFSGFFQPVNNPPTVNVVNAGRAIPVKFSLSGDKGLNIFGPGYPASQQIACSDNAPVSEIEQTVTAGGSSLSYDAESDTYTYVWKTEEPWAGTCRQLIVRLNDGSERVAFFKFK